MSDMCKGRRCLPSTPRPLADVQRVKQDISIQCFILLNSLRELSMPFGHAHMGGTHNATPMLGFVCKNLKAHVQQN